MYFRTIWEGILISLTATLCVPLTLWLILCLNSAWGQRSRLRTRLMTSLLVASLLDTAVNVPIGLAYSDEEFNCHNWRVLANISYTEDFVGNWTLVLLLAVYLAQLYHYDPTLWMTYQKALNLTRALVAAPWFIAVIMVAIVSNSFQDCKQYVTDTFFTRFLFFATATRAVPLVLTVGMAGLAACLRPRKLREQRRQAGHTEAATGNASFDPVLPYVLMAGSIAIPELPSLVMPFFFDKIPVPAKDVLFYVGVYVRYLKNILLPVSFLVFLDVREQACDVTRKLWMRGSDCFWRRSGQDTAVSYDNLHETHSENINMDHTFTADTTHII